MNELEVINTVTNVATATKGVLTQFRQYGIVQKHQLQLLSDDLERIRQEKRILNRLKLTQDLLDSMRKVYDMVQSFPQNSPLFVAGMRELDRLNSDLDRIIQDYMNK